MTYGKQGESSREARCSERSPRCFGNASDLPPKGLPGDSCECKDGSRQHPPKPPASRRLPNCQREAAPCALSMPCIRRGGGNSVPIKGTGAAVHSRSPPSASNTGGPPLSELTGEATIQYGEQKARQQRAAHNEKAPPSGGAEGCDATALLMRLSPVTGLASRSGEPPPRPAHFPPRRREVVISVSCAEE